MPTENPVSVNPVSLDRHLVYGRKNRKLSSAQKKCLEDLSALYAIETPYSRLSARILFGKDCPLWLEIGFGKGEHLLKQAASNPDVGIIGCEPFLAGLSAALGGIRDLNSQMVRVYRGSAVDILNYLPKHCLSRVFLLHPDPWPKRRHAARRFITSDRLNLLRAKMEPGAELRIGTDHPVYLRWTLGLMKDREDFTWMACAANDWQLPPDDWPLSRYAKKAISEGRQLWFLRFIAS